MLDSVLAAEHFVDLDEVVGAGEEILHVTLGVIALLQMSTFAELAGLIVCGWRNHATRLETVVEIELRLHIFQASVDLEGE